MKKSLGIVSLFCFCFLFSGSAYSDDYYFVCQQLRSTGELGKIKLLYELKNNKLYSEGSEQKLLQKPKITDTSIVLRHEWVWMDTKIMEIILNRKNGNMIQKYYKNEDDEDPLIVYLVCDIF